MTAIWTRLPVIVRAVLTGALVATLGTGPWAILVGLNLKHGAAVPWSVPPAALLLWLFWRYARGDGWPRSTSAARREALRARRVPDDVWGAALFAGGIGLFALLLFQRVLNRMVALPQQQTGDLSHVPGVTLFIVLLMSAAVAGVTEEASFRGYMQGPIERRHGPLIAILITGLMFGLIHFTHPEVTLALLPFYMGAAAVYGTVTWLTNSILPAIVLHAGGNVLVGFGLLFRGESEWQASPAPLVWQTGPDPSFWVSIVAFLVVGTVAVWAYLMLAETVRASTRGALSPGNA